MSYLLRQHSLSAGLAFAAVAGVAFAAEPSATVGEIENPGIIAGCSIVPKTSGPFVVPVVTFQTRQLGEAVVSFSFYDETDGLVASDDVTIPPPPPAGVIPPLAAFTQPAPFRSLRCAVKSSAAPPTLAVRAVIADAAHVPDAARVADAAQPAPIVTMPAAPGLPTPVPTPSPVPTVPPTPAPATPSPMPTITPAPTLTPPPTATPMPTITPTPMPTPTPTPAPTITPSPVPTQSPSPIPTQTASPIPTLTASPIPKPVATLVPHAMPTVTPHVPTFGELAKSTPVAAPLRIVSPGPPAPIARSSATPIATASATVPTPAATETRGATHAPNVLGTPTITECSLKQTGTTSDATPVIAFQSPPAKTTTVRMSFYDAAGHFAGKQDIVVPPPPAIGPAAPIAPFALTVIYAGLRCTVE